jgi:hypothetical protein
MAKTTSQKITMLDEQIKALENQKKLLLQKEKAEAEKAKKIRLQNRGAKLEKAFPHLATLSDSEFESFLAKAFPTETQATPSAEMQGGIFKKDVSVDDKI